MKVYHGKAGKAGRHVAIRDIRAGVNELLSPASFMQVNGWEWDWGCTCPGALHLAIALLMEACGLAPAVVIPWASYFLLDVVQHFPKKEWMLRADWVEEWVNNEAVYLSLADAIGGRTDAKRSHPVG